jgi:hypothetical protein
MLALRDDAIKKADTRMTDRNTKKIGFVVKGLSPKIGGRKKSLLLGGTNSSPVALNAKNARTLISSS